MALPWHAPEHRGHRDTRRQPTEKDIPAVLLTPLSVTAGNIKDTLVKDGLYTVGQICTHQPPGGLRQGRAQPVKGR